MKDDLFVSPSEKYTPVDPRDIRDVGPSAVRVATRFLASKENYPWDDCIKDQMERYHNKETAEKVCGTIKAKSQGLGSHK